MQQAPASGLTLILGPMYSRKTESLIEKHRLLSASQRVLAVKPSMDNRYAEAEIVSHSGQRIPALPVASLAELQARSDWDVLLVDEGQFLPGLVEFCRAALQREPRGKQIYIAALSGDAYAEPWELVSRLLPLASSVLWLCAECGRCGAPAAYTARLHNGPKVQVGGADKFWPACTLCFFANLALLSQDT